MQCIFAAYFPSPVRCHTLPPCILVPACSTLQHKQPPRHAIDLGFVLEFNSDIATPVPEIKLKHTLELEPVGQPDFTLLHQPKLNVSFCSCGGFIFPSILGGVLCCKIFFKSLSTTKAWLFYVCCALVAMALDCTPAFSDDLRTRSHATEVS